MKYSLKRGLISHRSGFTLIELLVVIAVIGILAAVVLASLNSARSKARDARRLTDIRTIQTALDMYYSDYGSYPLSNAGSTSCASYSTFPNTSWCNSIQKNSNGRWIANGALTPYLPEDPGDPKPAATADANNDSGGVYFYVSVSGGGLGCASGQYYVLYAGMEVVSNRKHTPNSCNGSNHTLMGTFTMGKSVQ